VFFCGGHLSSVSYYDKLLRRIFGPVIDRGMWRIISNKEVADL
jgi:hypothetical protein